MSRSRNRFKTFCWLLAGLATAAIVISGSIYLADHLSSSSSTRPCSGVHADHHVAIHGDQVTPDHTTAKRCDRLTITNLDDTTRLMAFGTHEHHTPYDGVEERLLGKGQSFSVTLDKTGSFQFHDHLHDEVKSTFRVSD